MGFFDKLFGGDPRKDLERARKLLDTEPRRALELARKAASRDDLTTVGNQAETLVDEARQKVVAWATEQADRAEESEYLDDAIEWLGTAVEEAEGDVREQLAARRQGLVEAMQTAEIERQAAALRRPFEDLQAELAEQDDADDQGGHDDAEGHFDPEYDVFVGMLHESLAEMYLDQPDEFQQAVLALHDGRAEEALEVFDRYVGGSGSGSGEEGIEAAAGGAREVDPIRRLERGRARLLTGDAAGAAEDFDAARAILGDDPIDLAGNQSVPGLWAEAMGERGEHAQILVRLAEIANPRHATVDVVLPYARALVETEKLEEATVYLESAINFYPMVPDFPLLHATVLEKLERPADAIAVLERYVAPSCATGNCNAPPKHLPSMRRLVRLHLDAEDPERARSLLLHVAQALGGRISAEDHRMSAEYFRQIGHDEAAAEAEETARELAARGPGAVTEPLALRPQTGKAAL